MKEKTDKFNQLYKTFMEEVSTFLDSENKLENNERRIYC